MGTVGFVLMVYEYLLEDFSIALLIGITGTYLAMLDMMVPRPEIFTKEKGFKPLAAILPVCAWGMVIAGAIIDIGAVKVPLLSAGVILFVYLMYMFNLIAGGADAKALMSLSLLVPVIPSTDIIPILSSTDIVFSFFPFAILAFIFSIVAYLLGMIYFGVKNATRGDILFPQMFIGYRMDVDSVPSSFVWPMEHPEGKPFVKITDLDSVVVVKEYLDAGKRVIWVTPQHPGILYLLLGFVLAFIIGNPFLLLTGGM